MTDATVVEIAQRSLVLPQAYAHRSSDSVWWSGLWSASSRLRRRSTR